MKVGQQRVNDPKAKSGRDEQTRFRFARRDELAKTCFACAKGCSFQTTHCGRAHRQDGPPGTFRATDALRRLRRNLVRFAVHHMRFHCFRPNGLKSSQSNVQRELANFNSTLSNLFEDFRGEMQSRSGCGDRARLPGENRLVAFAVGNFVDAINVRRKWNMTQPANLVIHCSTLARRKTQGTLALIAMGDYFDFKFALAESHSLANMKFLARPN